MFRGGKNWRKKSKGFSTSKKEKEVSRIAKFQSSKNSHRLEAFLNCPHQLTYDCKICAKHISLDFFCCKKVSFYLFNKLSLIHINYL